MGSGEFFVYILRCSNGALYTGYTTDVKRRFKEHTANPRGAKFTRGFKALEIAAAWAVDGDRGDAMRVESYIKKLNRKEKDRIIADPACFYEEVIEKLGVGVSQTSF